MLFQYVSSDNCAGLRWHLPDYQRHLGSKGLLDTLGRKRGTVQKSDAGSIERRTVCVRDEDGRGRGSSLLDGILYRRENGLAEMLSARLLGVGASDNVRACFPASIGYVNAA